MLLRSELQRSERPPCISKTSTHLRPAACRSQRPRATAPRCCQTCSTLVKICGVTSQTDAKLAAASGADFIGMIMWPKARRAVDQRTARDVASTAREHGAEPVGVFVDEGAEQIAEACERAGIKVAQLHGDQSRAALAVLPPWVATIYVMHADAAGTLQTALPASGEPDWLLVDGMKGGSGQKLDWSRLRAPAPGSSRRGWMLAGGLAPTNVANAIGALAPTVVDVSSGVAGPDGIVKDPARIHAFMQAAKGVCQPA